MTNLEKLNELFKVGNAKSIPKEEWYISLLSSIAESLAIIADKMTENTDEEGLNE